jgi:hypothetical protein
MKRFKYINQLDKTILKMLLLNVLFRSTCFGHVHVHHQELTTALTASRFTLERGGRSVLSRGLAGYNRPDHD